MCQKQRPKGPTDPGDNSEGRERILRNVEIEILNQYPILSLKIQSLTKNSVLFFLANCPFTLVISYSRDAKTVEGTRMVRTQCFNLATSK